MRMPTKKEKNERIKFQRALGAHIRKVRQSLSLTQEQLAKKSRIYRVNITQIESGIMNPSSFVLKKLSDGMKISLSKLLKGFK